MNGRLVIVFVISTFMILGTSTIATQNAFAQTGTDDLKWQLVMITSNPTCYNYDFQIMNKYTEISENYLELYKVVNSKYPPLCFSEKKYLSEYDSPSDLDLLLLVYDEDLGRKELHSQKIGGFYHHFGNDIEQNHVIVFCDCPTFNYSNPAWILSHELSHFVLNYLSYDESIVEDLVHFTDKKYDECLENYDNTCRNIETSLRMKTDSASYSVMPVYEPATSKDRNQVFSNNISDEMKELGGLMTNWLTSGTITETQYNEGIGLIEATATKDASMDSETHFADSAVDDTPTWTDVLSANSNKSVHDIFFLVPESIKTEKAISNDDNTLSLSDWFKETGVSLVDAKITNTNFLEIINDSNTEEIINEPENIVPEEPENIVTEEPVEDEFQIDFQTQQDYFEKLRNKIGLLEKENNEQSQQEIGKLSEQLELHLKALKYYYHGYYNEAAKHYEMILEVDPLDVIAIYNAGVSYAKQNMFDESIVYFGKILEFSPAEQTEVSELRGLTYELPTETKTSEVKDLSSDDSPALETKTSEVKDLSSDDSPALETKTSEVKGPSSDDSPALETKISEVKGPSSDESS